MPGYSFEGRGCEEVKLNLAYGGFGSSELRLYRVIRVYSIPPWPAPRSRSPALLFERGACTAVSMPGWWAVTASRWISRVVKADPTASVIHGDDDQWAAAPGCASIWMVEEKGIEPHVPVWEKAERKDGTFSRSDFIMTQRADHYMSCRQTAQGVLEALVHPEPAFGKDPTIRYHPPAPAQTGGNAVCTHETHFADGSPTPTWPEWCSRRVLVDRDGQNLRRMAKYLGTGSPRVPEMA